MALDAVYCALTGSIALRAKRPLGAMFGVSPVLVGAAGGLTIAWSGLVAGVHGVDEWQVPVRAVAAANSLAAIGLLVAASRHPRPRASVLLGAVGVEVAAFAVSQVTALRAQPDSTLVSC